MLIRNMLQVRYTLYRTFPLIQSVPVFAAKYHSRDLRAIIKSKQFPSALLLLYRTQSLFASQTALNHTHCNIMQILRYDFSFL